MKSLNDQISELSTSVPGGGPRGRGRGRECKYK